MKIRYHALLGVTSVSLAYAQDFAPQTWFEDLPAEDQSILRCYTFRTIPGVRYQLESSLNLVDWHQESALYGLGQDYTVPMHPVSSAASGSPSSGQTLTNASLLVRPSSANSGDLVLSWPSLANEAPLTLLLSGAAAVGWDSLPLFSWHEGTYQFFIRYETAPTTPPAETPALGTLDGAMIEAFRTAILSINDAIANSTALTRNTPLVPELGERKFWRIRYDWTSDLDRDGTPDWAEFAKRVPEAEGAEAQAVVVIALSIRIVTTTALRTGGKTTGMEMAPLMPWTWRCPMPLPLTRSTPNRFTHSFRFKTLRRIPSFRFLWRSMTRAPCFTRVEPGRVESGLHWRVIHFRPHLSCGRR
jgi:hypothetical protein